MRHKIPVIISSVGCFALATAAHGFTPQGEDTRYEVDGESFSGYFVSGGDNPKGSVIIVHDWDGLDDYERQRADMLAEEGYDAFAVDLFGEGNRPQAIEDKQAATRTLYWLAEML